MPFDSAPRRDDLADIDRRKPLSITSIRRIVGAARAAGLLAMDHVTELRLIVPPPDVCPYLTPHGAVDAFLGVPNRGSCPCNVRGDARGFLERLNNVHRSALFYIAVGTESPTAVRLRAEFDALLDCPEPSFDEHSWLRSRCDPKAVTESPELGMAREKRGRSMAAVDDHVGARIRERRIMLGLTQQQLVGVTPQQAHKYELGINRISAGRLFEIARVLRVPVGYFYEGSGEEGGRQVTQRERMMLKIARNFADITDARHQEAVSRLARALAGRD